MNGITQSMDIIEIILMTHTVILVIMIIPIITAPIITALKVIPEILITLGLHHLEIIAPQAIVHPAVGNPIVLLLAEIQAAQAEALRATIAHQAAPSAAQVLHTDNMEEELQQRIERSEKVSDHPSLVGSDPSYVILNNQITIMKALKELIEEKNKPTFGQA